MWEDIVGGQESNFHTKEILCAGLIGQVSFIVDSKIYKRTLYVRNSFCIHLMCIWIDRQMVTTTFVL